MLQSVVASVQCHRQVTRQQAGEDHMFPLTVSPSLATRSTGSSVNLWMAAVTPMKNVRLAENLGFSPTAIVTGSAACQAPSAALGGEAEALHHEGLTTTYLSYLLCNSSHVTMCLCPFKFLLGKFGKVNPSTKNISDTLRNDILFIFRWQRLCGASVFLLDIRIGKHELRLQDRRCRLKLHSCKSSCGGM